MADVATLFLWVYGWVGVAIICALIGPVWHFLDPFSTLHDIGAWVLARLGVAAGIRRSIPRGLGDGRQRSASRRSSGSSSCSWPDRPCCSWSSIGYTAFTLAMMAQFGRDEWRSQGETFTVWFRLLGRLAWFRLVDEDGRVERRTFGSGLLEPGWTRRRRDAGRLRCVVDHLRRAVADAGLLRRSSASPQILEKTVLLFAFLGLVVALAFLVARTVGLAAIGAGLLPIAVGYLIAHYLTYLLIDGQRILIAISDPFQKGWDLFGTAFHQPTGALVAARARLDDPARGRRRRPHAGRVGRSCRRGRGRAAGLSTPALRRRQLPLAVVMVALTTLTLWSLGQAIIVSPPPNAEVLAPITRAVSARRRPRVGARELPLADVAA